MHMKASIILAAILAMSVFTLAAGSAPKAFAHQADIDFATNVEFIRGHLDKAIENKAANNTALATAHAGHPVEEVYSLITGEIDEHDAELNTRLETNLNGLFEQISELSLEDVETRVADINTDLDAAVEAVVPASESGEPAFWAAVAGGLLETAEHEYEEGVVDGAVAEEIEYQDASAFINRAKAVFEQFKADAPAHEAEEIEEFFGQLDGLVANLASPGEVETVIDSIQHELEEIQGAGGSSAEFVANVEFIRGHLEKAIENKNAGNIELAIAHSGHPIDEIYSLIEADISSQNAELNTELKGALTALANQANTATATEFESSVNAILPMLDDAVEAVAGDEAAESQLWAETAVLLLETANLEYGEAVEGGEIVEMIEYQDASAFIHRAEVAFEAIKADMPEHEVEEVEEFFAELNSLVSSNASPDQVAAAIGGINHEFAEVFGLEEAEGELDGWGYIDRITELLDESLEQYEAGNFVDARANAVEAYLDNYEFIEADIAEDNEELMEQIEVDMRVDLVKMIDDRAPAEDIQAHVDQIKADLETARAVVTPEFPVAAIVASLGIAGTMAYGRLRGSGKRA
jgi:hypothetical protein